MRRNGPSLPEASAGRQPCGGEFRSATETRPGPVQTLVAAQRFGVDRRASGEADWVAFESARLPRAPPIQAKQSPGEADVEFQAAVRSGVRGDRGMVRVCDRPDDGKSEAESESESATAG
jgi:hypothetical protein